MAEKRRCEDCSAVLALGSARFCDRCHRRRREEERVASERANGTTPAAVVTLLPDQLEHLEERVGERLAERLALNGNGAAPSPPNFPPNLAEEIAERIRLGPPRIALTYEEAAKSLGIGRTLFIEEVAPHLRVLRIRGKRVIPVAELERFIAEQAERPWLEQLTPERTRS